MTQNKAVRLLLVLSAVICAGGGTCGDEDIYEIYDACFDFDSAKASCAGIEPDGCDYPCDTECAARGELALEKSSDCAQLYVAYYECVTALSCEEISAWAEAVVMGSTDYDCFDQDQKFRAECGDLQLHGLD